MPVPSLPDSSGPWHHRLRHRRLHRLPCLAHVRRRRWPTLTAACGVIYLALRGFVLLIDARPGDPMQQHYFCFYVAVLSALLIHYYFDQFLFRRIGNVITTARSPDAPPCHALAANAVALKRRWVVGIRRMALV